MLALGIAVLLFLSSQRQMVLAGHDATVRPTLSGKVVLHTGPVLPDVRLDSPAPVGMDVVLGKTELKSLDELFQRYALLAASPEGQRAQVQSAVESMAVGALVRGAALAMVAVVGGVLLWRLPGPARRAELWRRLRAAGGTRREVEVIALATVTVMAVVVALWQPWAGEPRLQSDEASGPVAGE
ncbi:MAG: metallophosphoesterase, partial [Nocardioides sp.]|nr:metallophosphoesterase [Nocardioides sp.]